MKLLKKTATTLFLLGIALAQSGAQETEFIEGFPDVPLVGWVRGIEGEPVVFDTVAGTVAEVTLLIEGGGFKTMEAYNSTLTSLGWQCELADRYLRCDRDKNRLIFFDTDPQKKNGKIILRLEPKE